MDFSSVLVLLIALIVGVTVGLFFRRRASNAALPLMENDLRTTNGQLPLANLILYLGEQSDTQRLLMRAAEWLTQEGYARLVVIYPYDAAAHELSQPISMGADIPQLTPRYRLGVGIFGEVASTREAHYIDRVPAEPRFGSTAAGIEVAYVTPLYFGVTLIGVLAVQSSNRDAFPPEERTILDRFASVIALQALVSRRYTDSQQAIARFGRFQELSQRLIERLDTQNLLTPIVEAAREMLDTQMSILLELRPGDECLHPVAWSGISQETAMMLESRLKEDLKGLVAWAHKPARTPDLRTDQRTARATHAVVAGMISELAVPVMYQDKVYGTLAVETNVYRNFTDEEMNLLMALAAQAGIALRNAQLFETVQSTNTQLEKAFADLQTSQTEIERAHTAEIRAYELEMETAREIQTSLLPQEKPPVPQIELAARNIPAQHVSGDFYQYLLLPDGKLGIAVGDVSGKGMPAALLMAVTTTALRDEIARTPSAAGVLNELNSRLLARMKQTNMNSAMLMCIFDPLTNTIDIANAGMVQPYMRTARNWESVPIGGYPLGASGRSNYSAKTCPLPAGSMLLFLTDGVIECQNAAGEFFGFERFEAMIATLPITATPDDVVEQVLTAVYAHAGEAIPQDDITVVVMQATPIAAFEVIVPAA